MTNSFNPFTEQINVEYFVGREHLLQQFRDNLNGLRSRVPNHQFIAGVHGTGKTSLLAKLVELSKSEGFLAVMPILDAEVLSRGHIFTIMRSLISGVELTPGVRVSGLVSDWDKGKDSVYFQLPKTEDLKSDRLRHDLETVQKLLKEANIPGAVICIDEGQRIDGRALSALKNSLQMLDYYLLSISLRIISDSDGAVVEGRRLLETKAAEEAEGDIGAARFYVTGIPIGPFETNEEAADCIHRRLYDNVIQFDDEVIERIGWVNGRTPKNMISFSSALYNDAKRINISQVDVKVFNQTFRSVHGKKLSEAETFIINSSFDIATALRGLLELGQAADASTIANHLYPGIASDVRETLAEGIQGNLEHVCSTTPFCNKVQDRFEMSGPIDAYSVGLAIGLWK